MKKILREVKQRLKLAFHILRGRPTMYKMKIEGRFTVDLTAGNTHVVRCIFSQKDLPKNAPMIYVGKKAGHE